MMSHKASDTEEPFLKWAVKEDSLRGGSVGDVKTEMGVLRRSLEHPVFALGAEHGIVPVLEELMAE